jgi:hypothetical protein
VNSGKFIANITILYILISHFSFRYDPEWKTTIYGPGYAPVLRKGGWR